MLYAREVIDLMAAFPGRQFRVRQLVQYVSGRSGSVNSASTRKAIQRVLKELIELGSVEISAARYQGSYALYNWKA